MGRRKVENNIKSINKIKVLLILLVILIITYFVYTFIKKNINATESNIIDIYKETTKQVVEDKNEIITKLEKLQKENNDIVAYLEIPGTNISYPVVKAKDNDYYMYKNYKKKYSRDGSIFLDKDVDLNLPSSNFLIYGHNNENGRMFSDLIKYKKESYYKQHPNIIFVTNKEYAEYEIIAVFLSKVYYKTDKNVFRYYYFVNAKTQAEYEDYINNSKKASIYDTGKTAEYGDQLITLSTCSYHTEDGRLAIVARKK